MNKPENSLQKRALLRAVETFEAAYAGSPAEEYLESRGIGARTAAAHRVGYVDPERPLEGWERFAGRISLPYLNLNKEPTWAKFRAQPGMGDVKAKYAQQEGGRGRLFNVQALAAPGDLICLTEGETDVMTLTALGIPAVGVPGARAWKSYMSRCLDGYSRVVLWYDDDMKPHPTKPGKFISPGKDLVAAIREKMPDVIPLAAPGGHNDVNDAYRAGLGDAIRRLAYGIEDTDNDDRPRLGTPSRLEAPGVQEGGGPGDDPDPTPNRFDGISNPAGPVPF